MNFGDKVIYGLTNDVEANLHREISHLNDMISNMQINGKIDFVVIALRGLATYTATLLKRLNSCQEVPIEFCAITARNLFECYLLVAFILSDHSKAKEFLGRKVSEELDINEGFLSLTNSGTAEATKKPIVYRIEYLKGILQNEGLTHTKPWTISYLAEYTNNKIEYKAFFKLYSKYVHPSSWIVNDRENEYDNPVFRNIFLMQGQHYGSCILKLLSAYQADQTGG